ncbi:cell wall protein RBR3-like [Cucumis melo var. makuwa]|uniref:Cell wall protein RBR3-like n=1 Tax=Cucumis melo var. makuwa TaxID=1194695 RepID=A0A5D3DC23_CUCMM|nr:cell wall protein RBR3-like [Cucumis melo var. makuwa]TYK21122.1 cell wall protein RBR3-like [Cucumis melo var. makuwa]
MLSRLTFPFVHIDGILFHIEENVQRWRYVVQRRIADDVNVFDKHHSCLNVMGLIEKVGLSKTISNVGPFCPQLIRKSIVNLPSDFNNSSSPNYQTVHIRGFKFKISPVVINGFLGNNVEPNSSPSNPSNEVLASMLSGGTPFAWLVNGIPTISLSIKYVILHKIEGSNIPDIEHGMRSSRAPHMFDMEDLGESVEGFFVNRDIASIIANTLKAESQALSTSIHLLSE